MAYISLNLNAVAAIDDADFDRVDPYDWFLSGTGYPAGFVPVEGKFKLVYLHRFLLNAQPGEIVDHINGCALDNRRANLRLVTAGQNGQNKRLSALSATGLKGVGWHKARRKYHARIQLQGMRYHLGFFENAQSAAQAYDAAARVLFGAFAVLNYPDEATPQSVAVQVRERLRRRGMKLVE